MINIIGKYLLMAAVFGITAALSGLSAAAWGRLISAEDTVKFCLKQPVTVSEALEAAEQNQQIKEAFQQGKTETGQPLDFCIWGREEDVLLTNGNLSGQAQADAILLCGNPELVFGDSRLPAPEDTEGCLTDEKTAWELFGSLDVVGKEITCQEKTYTIRKVIAGQEPFIAFQVNHLSEKGQKKSFQDSKTDVTAGSTEGKRGQEELLDRMEVSLPEHVSAGDLPSICMSQLGISPEILDLELLRGIGGACLLLAPVTVSIFFARYLWRQYRAENSLPEKAAAAGCCLLLGVLLVFFLKNQVHIPDAYIPSRWSEFSFWSNLWKEKTDGIKLLVQMPKSEPDIQWMKDFARTAVLGLLAEVSVVISGTFYFAGKGRGQQKETQKKT